MIRLQQQGGKQKITSKQESVFSSQGRKGCNPRRSWWLRPSICPRKIRSNYFYFSARRRRQATHGLNLTNHAITFEPDFGKNFNYVGATGDGEMDGIFGAY
jgi:hypothetical protein